MKVALLIDNLNSGGAQRQIVNLAIGLKTEGADVTVITYTAGEHFQDDLRHHAIDVRSVIRSSKYRTFLAVSREIRQQRPDIVCAYMFVPSLMALITRLYYWKPKVFVSERFIEHLMNDWAKLPCRILYPLASGIIANSQTQTGILKKKLPWVGKKIVHIPNCVDTDIFRPAPDQQKSSVGPSLELIGIGRITHYKNLKVFIEAVHILRQEKKIPVSVKWIGREYEKHGEENAYFKECVDEVVARGLTGIWKWEGKKKNVAELYQQADLLVHPSFGEGFPNVICEALATGTVVIASNVIDHPMIIKERYNGFLFHPQQARELAEKIASFYELPAALKQQMKQHCRLTATQNFSPESMISAYLTLFKKALA